VVEHALPEAPRVNAPLLGLEDRERGTLLHFIAGGLDGAQRPVHS
jgi:hypothetical protein